MSISVNTNELRDKEVGYNLDENISPQLSRVLGRKLRQHDREKNDHVLSTSKNINNELEKKEVQKVRNGINHVTL